MIGSVAQSSALSRTGTDVIRARLKELGVALGVLAIYLLVLLSPLHQAAGLQRDLDALGFTSLDTWSICGQLANVDDEDAIPVVKCAAGSIGNNQVAILATAPAPLQFFRVASQAFYWRPSAALPILPPKHAGQPRAPPISE